MIINSESENYAAYVAAWESSGGGRLLQRDNYLWLVYLDPDPVFVRIPKDYSWDDSPYGPYNADPLEDW